VWCRHIMNSSGVNYQCDRRTGEQTDGQNYDSSSVHPATRAENEQTV